MNSLKDRVSEKLSRLFSDSSGSSPPVSPSSTSQARSNTSGGKSLTSYLSFMNPSAIFDGSNQNQRQVKRSSSHPARGHNAWQPLVIDDELPSICESNENLNICKDNKPSGPVALVQEKNKEGNNPPNDGGHASGTTSSNSNMLEEATDEKPPQKLLANLLNDSVFISSELYEFFNSSLPNIVKGCKWALVYSTLKDGISLRTLIRKSAEVSGPALLIAGDMKGAVFGGMLECPLKPTSKRKYQGTHQTFVFTTIYGEPRLFRPTGANRYYFMCMNDLLALGGGGSYALHLEEDLLRGTSGTCETFASECLAHTPEFEVKNIELWGFTHASQYLI